MNKSIQERRSIVDKANKKISINRQCQMFGLHRSGVYYKAAQEKPLNLELMKRIDKQYTQYPFMGVPSMTQWLNKDMDYKINKKRIERLFKLMGISAIVPGPHTSKGNKLHKKYPYLLRDLAIVRPNQVWEIDITYVPINGGYMYLIAIIDTYSRFVVGWSLSNTMEKEWCVEAVNKAIEDHGKPEILNSDQGSQFTSELFTQNLLDQKVTISMDGKGRATDNIFIERLWRSLKYEDIYLKAYDNGTALFQGLTNYFGFYNLLRRHSSIDFQFPSQLYGAA
jgi:putative transposase